MRACGGDRLLTARDRLAGPRNGVSGRAAGPQPDEDQGRQRAAVRLHWARPISPPLTGATAWRLASIRGMACKYPPAKPGALGCEPLKAVGRVADAAREFGAA